MDAIETATRIVVSLLVRNEWNILESLTRGRRLTASQIEEGIIEYGQTLRFPPDEGWVELGVMNNVGGDPHCVAVVMPLWTVEEGRSDLILELTLNEIYYEAYDIEIDDIHVM